MTNNPVIDGIINLEGGYVNNPADRGGPTNWGITEAVARTQGYKGDMQDLTRAEAYDILEKCYWLKPGFDRVEKLSLILAFELCESSTNIGSLLPCKWLQRWLNAFNQEQKAYANLVVDGLIGDVTIQALSSFLQQRGKEGEHVLLKALNCCQGEYYLSITEKRHQNKAFIYGWLRERVTIK